MQRTQVVIMGMVDGSHFGTLSFSISIDNNVDGFFQFIKFATAFAYLMFISF